MKKSFIALSVLLTASQANATTIGDSPYEGKTLVTAIQYDWEPLSYKNDQGQPTGYFYDIANEAAHRLGAKLAVTSGDFAAVIPAIQSGKFTLAAGLDATPERQQVVDIASTVRAGYQLIVLKNSPLKQDVKLNDLCGKTIALLASHPSTKTFEQISQQCESSGKSAVKVSQFPDRGATWLALRSGRADATLGYTGENGWLLQKQADLKRVGPIFDTVYAGIPVSKSSGNAKYWVEAINSLIKDGTYQKILAKYGVEDVAIDHSELNPGK
ncbi:transporter substrate-binding domain-containing protein [Erwinia sp. JUb26]|uniref:transporter substrate-binding domain-containing protein n=1 Tax=Erwinia sp. JUb26 TaxID=2485126 RepID=UPI000F46DAB0|nr:transporter substrate-binding domain-containing protein [Erwinia sp. JUb26]ROR09891.1 amino acid ABC transporter substrate-binding protein (PAAT family) [Erwinia sp. JUb26]